ncbi:hypothetical protein H4219_003389 [Mycoemilia scoparia]|uniref:Fungal-type protein kinase domain-containing protein n=1 Tax=Mycoemilia scoparia TaxID=417184 RepID=A0A9W8A4B8_9FUNG|nr:hypothetical protein H4219_003389 [Mycoemilia scoparia]
MIIGLLGDNLPSTTPQPIENTMPTLNRRITGANSQTGTKKQEKLVLSKDCKERFLQHYNNAKFEKAGHLDDLLEYTGLFELFSDKHDRINSVAKRVRASLRKTVARWDSMTANMKPEKAIEYKFKEIINAAIKEMNKPKPTHLENINNFLIGGNAALLNTRKRVDANLYLDSIKQRSFEKMLLNIEFKANINDPGNEEVGQVMEYIDDIIKTFEIGTVIPKDTDDIKSIDSLTLTINNSSIKLVMFLLTLSEVDLGLAFPGITKITKMVYIKDDGSKVTALKPPASVLASYTCVIQEKRAYSPTHFTGRVAWIYNVLVGNERRKGYLKINVHKYSRQSEIAALKEIKQKSVLFVPALKASSKEDCEATKHFIEYMVFEDHGKRINEYFEENMSCIEQIDIREATLIDWGYSKIVKGLGDGNENCQDPITGTLPFMSIRVLHKCSNRTVIDDLESLFYVLLFCVALVLKTNKPVDEMIFWNTNAMDLLGGLRSFVMADYKNVKKAAFGPNVYVPEKVDAVLREFYDILFTGYDGDLTGANDPRVEKFGSMLEKLQTKFGVQIDNLESLKMTPKLTSTHESTVKDHNCFKTNKELMRAARFTEHYEKDSQEEGNGNDSNAPLKLNSPEPFKKLEFIKSPLSKKSFQNETAAAATVASDGNMENMELSEQDQEANNKENQSRSNTVGGRSGGPSSHKLKPKKKKKIKR